MRNQRILWNQNYPWNLLIYNKLQFDRKYDLLGECGAISHGIATPHVLIMEIGD